MYIDMALHRQDKLITQNNIVIVINLKGIFNHYFECDMRSFHTYHLKETYV